MNDEYFDFFCSCSDSPDSIVVRDGMEVKAPVIAQYCNTMNEVQVLSSSSGLFVEFLTDEKKQRQGFAAKFEFVKADVMVPKRPSTPPTKSSSSPGRCYCVFFVNHPS